MKKRLSVDEIDADTDMVLFFFFCMLRNQFNLGMFVES